MIMNDCLNNNSIKDDNESTLDFHQAWNLFFACWYWFLISVIFFVLIAGVHLWFSPQKINIITRIQIMDKSRESSQMSLGVSMLSSLSSGLGSGLGGSLGGNLGLSGGTSTEEEILMSNALLCDVVNDLSLHTEYRQCSWGRRILLYKNQPVNVSIPKTYLQWYPSGRIRLFSISRKITKVTLWRQR